MDFAWTEEQQAFKSSLQSFIEAEIKPHLTSWYRDDVIPRELFAQMAERQFLGYREVDGRWVEAPTMNQTIAAEALAEVSPGIAVGLLAHAGLGLYALHRFGNEAQKERYFLPAVRGELISAFANTEPTAGSDVANISLQARPVSGGYLLNGTKMFITNGTLADFLVVSAVTDPEVRSKHEGISLFVLGTEGLKRRKIRKRVWTPSDLATLFFEDHFVPEGGLLGELNEGFKLIMRTFTSSRIGLAALAIGTALGAYRLALARANSRETFGKKLFDHQAKAFEFAATLPRLEAARLLVRKAAWLKDSGQDYTLAASMAKFYACEEAKAICFFAAEVFGASGIMEDNPIYKYPLDAWASALGEGTGDIQKLVISREVRKRLETTGPQFEI
ncbi:MAG: acyl-CoA dehydrogenase family protein [Candidatus Tectomicrobia bacterium]|uniref:Acyl-CoA dehydrogenase family protein n=1 Tax=Tectimicrobiota bacterium TaxID=2528274 RepID=A0A932CKX9_UNCTE|nr:acyl-CoA dehydrogenase family protein [Candidatus Tectomicrobia bacterium]